MNTADLVDARVAALTFCDIALRRFGRIGAFCGPIATVIRHDKSAPPQAFAEAPGGWVFCFADGAPTSAQRLS